VSKHPEGEDDSASADLSDKVRTWLAGTGFPLEFRVADAARSHMPHWLEQSRYFTDPTTGKVRETDVVVQWVGESGQVFANITLVIECKSKPQPWVVFDNNLVDNDARARLDWSVFWATERENLYGAIVDDGVPTVSSYVDVEKTLFRMSRLGTGIVSALGNEESRRGGGADGAWEAVQAAVAAAHGVGKDMTANATGRFDKVRIAVFPVVVTSGRLFRAYLSGGQLDVEEVRRAEILVRRGSEPAMTRCFVVTEPGLSALLAEAAATPKALVHDA